MHSPSFCAPNNKVHPLTKFQQCEQNYLANPNETPKTTFTRNHNTAGWTKNMHWICSWAHVNNQITYLFGARYPDSWMPQLTANESRASISQKPPQKCADSLPRKDQHQQKWITISGSIGPKPANHLGFGLLRFKLNVPLQTPGVYCCQILFQRFHYMGTQKRSRNNSIHCSIIRIIRNMILNNWKSSEVRNINNKGLKTLPWGTLETISTDALTLPIKCTHYGHYE